MLVTGRHSVQIDVVRVRSFIYFQSHAVGRTPSKKNGGVCTNIDQNGPIPKSLNPPGYSDIKQFVIKFSG